MSFNCINTPASQPLIRIQYQQTIDQIIQFLTGPFSFELPLLEGRIIDELTFAKIENKHS